MKDNKKISKFSDLFAANRTVQLINLITLYRIVTFPLLVALIFYNRLDIFKWLIIVSFLTDSVDGFMARRFKVNSLLGAKLDSIGDDLTILAAVIGLAVFRFDFLKSEWILFAIPLSLFLVQLISALIRYGKISSFHTYLAKLAAVLQGFFLCAMFLFHEPVYWLFYFAVAVTIIELIEEIIIVWLLPQWQTNVHGLYWVIKRESKIIE